MATQQSVHGERSPGSGRATRLLHAYLWLLMGSLFLQGIGSLLVWRRTVGTASLSDALIARFVGNPPHAWVHVLWGTAGLTILLTRRPARVRWWLALIFGLFYTLLGVLGVLVHDPFTLRLGLGENAFHLLAGPVALILAARARRDARPAPDLRAHPRLS